MNRQQSRQLPDDTEQTGTSERTSRTRTQHRKRQERETIPFTSSDDENESNSMARNSPRALRTEPT